MKDCIAAWDVTDGYCQNKTMIADFYTYLCREVSSRSSWTLYSTIYLNIQKENQDLRRIGNLQSTALEKLFTKSGDKEKVTRKSVDIKKM